MHARRWRQNSILDAQTLLHFGLITSTSTATTATTTTTITTTTVLISEESAESGEAGVNQGRAGGGNQGGAGGVNPPGGPVIPDRPGLAGPQLQIFNTRLGFVRRELDTSVAPLSLFARFFIAGTMDSLTGDGPYMRPSLVQDHPVVD